MFLKGAVINCNSFSMVIITLSFLASINFLLVELHLEVFFAKFDEVVWVLSDYFLAKLFEDVG